MVVEVLSGAEAVPGGSEVLEGWSALSDACPWSTPYCCPDLARTWYEAHDRVYEPLVLIERGPGGALEGLLALAKGRRDEVLVPAVHRDASVYGWLARPLRGSFFMERALVELGARFPNQRLELEALPEGAPTDWTSPQRPAGRLARVASAHHWRMTFDPARAAKKLDKRANSQQLAGLKRRGALRFEPGLSPEVFSERLDDFAAWYDRYALDNALASRFLDHPEEMVFWRRLPADAPSFRASALYAGDDLAAAVFGFRIRDRFHLAWGVENPAFETHAPSQVLWLMLEEHLLDEGVEDADVTAGFPWMRLGASEARDTVRISVLLDKRARFAHDLGRSVMHASRVALRLVDR